MVDLWQFDQFNFKSKKMKKVLFEFAITACLFFGIWFGFSQINWIDIFGVNEFNKKAEEKLGELSWEYFSFSENENFDDDIAKTVDSLVNHITKANGIDYEKIKVHVIQTDEINAFALPDGHLVLNSQLIIEAKNQEELLGVISHELAHIQLDHINEKLIKEIGLAVLVSAISGNNNQVIGNVVHTLSSTAFDRKNEEEADLTAIIYLENANVNPVPFADFLYRLSEDESESVIDTWMSTHPNSKERSKNIIKKMDKKKTNYVKVIDDSTWKKLQEQVSNSN